MLKFWPVNILFVFLALIITVLFGSLFACILLIPCYLGTILYGVINIRSGFFVKTISHGNELQKIVTLTFDDGPDPKNTPLVLNLLKEAGISATFFCIGEKLKRYPELAARINDEGHIIGNHSFYHTNYFPVKSATAIRKEIADTTEIIENITKKTNQYFRPPFGVTNPLIKKALKGLNLDVIGWSIRSFDLSKKSSEKITGKIISKLRGGDIVLLHDTSNQIIPILTALLEYLKNSGWQVVKLDGMIKGNPGHRK